MITTKMQAAERLLQSIPNPSRIKELHVDIIWKTTPIGDSSHTAVLIVAFLAVCIIAIAVCITVYNVKR